MSRKALIPAGVMAAIGTIVAFYVFAMLKIPDEFDILRIVLDTVYGAFRPLVTGQFGQMMDFAYLMGLLVVVFGMLFGLLAVVTAIGIVFRWMSNLR